MSNELDDIVFHEVKKRGRLPFILLLVASGLLVMVILLGRRRFR